MPRTWFKTWIFDRRDPTMLGMSLALVLMLLADHPWDHGCCRPSLEDGWVSTIWAQALAVMILSPGGWWRLLAFAAITALTAPSIHWPSLHILRPPLEWLPRFIGTRSDTAGGAMLGAQMLLALMVSGRMQNAKRDWATLLSHASMALAVVFLIWVEGERSGFAYRAWVLWPVGFWREQRILWFLLPAISIPMLFWTLTRMIPVAPRWLVSGSTVVAAVALGQILHRPQITDWMILIAVGVTGHLVCWIDRLLERQDEPVGGFEVVISR